MGWFTGPSQIFYQELSANPSPMRKYKRDGLDATRVLKVDWDDADALCQDMLGTTNIGGGSGGTAVAVLGTGAVASLAVVTGGSGYTSPPTLSFSGGGAGTGAAGTCTVSNGLINTVNLTSPGTGYTSAPTVTIAGGGGSGAVIAAGFTGSPIASITLNQGGSGYTNPPRVVIIGGGGSGASAVASVDGNGHITSVSLPEGGAGYTSVPKVSFANYTLRQMPVAYPNWWTNPWVEIMPPGQVPGPNYFVASVTVTEGGAGYTAPPAVNFETPVSGNIANAAKAVAVIQNGSVVRVNLQFPGQGYSLAIGCNVSFSGGGGAGATAITGLEPLRPVYALEASVQPLAGDIATEGGMENVYVTDPGGFAQVTVQFSDVPYRVGQNVGGAEDLGPVNNAFDLAQDGYPYFTEIQENFSGKDAPLPPQLFRFPDGTAYNQQLQYPIPTAQVTMIRRYVAVIPPDLPNLIATLNDALPSSYLTDNLAGKAPGTLRLLSYDEEPISCPSGQRLYHLKMMMLYQPAGHNNFLHQPKGTSALKFDPLTLPPANTPIFQVADWTVLFA